MAYRRVVVGTDGSETATAAVRHAAQLCAAFHGELIIVTAYSHRGAPSGHDYEIPDELAWSVTDSAVAEEHAVEAARVAREAGVTKVRARSEAGDPADALITVAGDLSADVIVVGSKGMSSRFPLGVVPNRVSHHAPCDVVIVRTAD